MGTFPQREEAGASLELLVAEEVQEGLQQVAVPCRLQRGRRSLLISVSNCDTVAARSIWMRSSFLATCVRSVCVTSLCWHANSRACCYPSTISEKPVHGTKFY